MKTNRQAQKCPIQGQNRTGVLSDELLETQYSQETIFISTIFVEINSLYNSAQQRAQQTHWPSLRPAGLSLVDAEVCEAD